MEDPGELLDAVEPVSEALLALVPVKNRPVAEHDPVGIGLDSEAEKSIIKLFADGVYLINIFTTFLNRALISEQSPEGAARNCFLTPMPQRVFEPTSVELHQTETFEVLSTD